MKYRMNDEDFTRFQALIVRQSGLHFPEKKRSELETAVFKALANSPARFTRVKDYYHYLNQSDTSRAKQELTQFINSLTVGETHFFRNSKQFDALAEHILPALIKRKREIAASFEMTPPVKPQLRIWSAGCATGEEAYSLAMMLHELIPDIDRWRITILATDINDDYLRQAREAVYSDWSFREARALAKRPLYFQRLPDQAQGEKYQLSDKIRSLVTFAHHNLIDESFPDVKTNTISMDLILCRNVTIYFTPDFTRRIIEKFHSALVDKGWLIVGHSEPSLMTYQAFTAHTIHGTLFYQKTGQPTPMPDAWKTIKPAQNGTAATTAPQSIFINQEASLETQLVKPPRRTDILRPLPASHRLNELSAYNQARLWLSDGQVEEAITLLETAKHLPQHEAPAFCLLARAYADLGNWQKARQACEQALETDPLLPEAYYVLALIEEHEGNIEPAIDNLRKLLYLDQERPLAYFNLAMLYKKRSQVDKAQRALKNTLNRIQLWPPDQLIPDSGHTSARSLSEAAQKLLDELNQAQSTL